MQMEYLKKKKKKKTCPLYSEIYMECIDEFSIRKVIFANWKKLFLSRKHVM